MRSTTRNSTIRYPAGVATLLVLLMSLSGFVLIEPAPYDVLLVALFGLFIAGGMRIPREIRLPALLLGVFVLGNTVAATLAPEPLQSLRSLGIRTYMVLAWLFFTCIIVADPERMLPALWRGYLVAAVLEAVIGIAEYYGYIPAAGFAGGLRAKATFKDPNVFGPFLVPAALYCLGEMRRSRPLATALYAGTLLLLVAAILLSFSRGAWINFLLSGLVLLLLYLGTSRPRREKSRLLLTAVVGVVAAGAVVVAAVTLTTAGDRFRDRAVLAKSYDLQQGGRFSTQIKALDRASTEPLGLGPGRTDEEFGLEPHNLYLHVLAEGGWAAGLAFVTFVAVTLARALRRLRWHDPLRDPFLVAIAASAGILVQSMFIDSTHWRHMWLMFALCSAYAVVAERRNVRRAAEPASRRFDRPQGSPIRSGQGIAL